MVIKAGFPEVVTLGCSLRDEQECSLEKKEGQVTQNPISPDKALELDSKSVGT